MVGTDLVDMGLFGFAAGPCEYDGRVAERRLAEETHALATAEILLDLKGEPSEDLLGEMQDMLSVMTKELRERFQRFQSQKVRAETEAETLPDEASRKLAQADAKAAIEAVSLIVRTLEKIDSIYRSIDHERRQAAESASGADDDEALVAKFNKLVDIRAAELVRARVAEERDDGGGPGGAASSACEDGENGP
ncbi:hypothetical protein [Sinorhizobium sp. BG8]|uniref:hypothetical protein n=1 Tax=Sinorhizobium sp. BG8 TaxID=2613773 RepID=UPI00193EB250|nr:hypothetical protein [Sinorhizobium sp. BG8]QRM54704.1 hypothetical protein F3Y30_09245 [Sinorhizobium sp. BG8]